MPAQAGIQYSEVVEQHEDQIGSVRTGFPLSRE